MPALVALLLATSSAESALPKADAMAAYSVLTYSGRRAAPGDPIIISHGHGRPPSFSIRRQSESRPAPLAFEVGSAVPYYEPDRSFYIDETFVDDIAREEEHRAVLENLDLHRPKQILTVRGEHPWQFANSGSSADYELCAVRMAMQSTRKLSSAADDPMERDQWLKSEPLRDQWNGYDLRASRLLVALVASAVRNFEAGDLTARARSQADQTDPWHWEWRKQMILNHGREFGWKTTVSGPSAAARLCRTLKPEPLAGRISDICEFSGVVDRRDGWPIFLGFTRTQRDERGASSHAGINFSRLRPNPSFVTPPALCR